MKVYVDTNVFLDWCFNREDSLYVEQFFERTVSCEFEIVISTVTIRELEKYTDLAVLKPLIAKIQFVTAKKTDDVKMEGIHYPDNVHITVAKRFNCEYIVSNDKQILANTLIPAIQIRFL